MDTAKKYNGKALTITLIMAAILWYIMFVVKPLNFWANMSISILLLIAAAFLSGYRLPSLKKPVLLRHVITGILSAALLYIIFYTGNIITGYLLPFKDQQVLSVYSNRSEGNLVWIGVLLLFVIGPGEEIFWRGYIQSFLGGKCGENKGYIIAALLYAGVHIITLNFMLVVAATVCGFYWGWLYKKEKSLVPVIISHGLWDLAIFVLFPLM